MPRYAMTVKQAKAEAKNILGRYPRCGREVCVARGQRWEDVRWNTPGFQGIRHTRIEWSLWLVNESGSLKLREVTQDAR